MLVRCPRTAAVAGPRKPSACKPETTRTPSPLTPQVKRHDRNAAVRQQPRRAVEAARVLIQAVHVHDGGLQVWKKAGMFHSKEHARAQSLRCPRARPRWRNLRQLAEPGLRLAHH
jgi:hypothetical protein